MNNKNIFWGVLLVIVGFFFLADNLNWIDFDLSFKAVSRFWPLLFILAGVSALVSQRRSALTPIMIAIAIPLALFHFVDNGVHSWGHNRSNNWSFDDDDDDNNHNKNDDDDNDDNNRHHGDAVKQEYTIENADDIKEATLNLKGGAAKFDLGTADTKLFVANTELERGSYMMTEDKKDGVKTIDFEMKNRKGHGFNFDFDDNHISNQVHLKMNPKVAWNLDMGIGAGDLEFDLTPYIIKSLNLETGAAAIDLKFGDKADLTNIKLKSGVASVKVSLPQSVGCQIKSSGALSDNDFNGFEKINGLWQTPGFDKAAKKIMITSENGLSSLKVSRY